MILLILDALKMIKDAEKATLTLVGQPFVNNDSNKFSITQLGMGSKFLFNPSFIKKRISAALCSFTSCTTPQPQLTRDICMLAKTLFWRENNNIAKCISHLPGNNKIM